MEFADVLRKRRMVRSFTDEPVDTASVERILHAAQRGPSAGYSQGVEFVVVTDDEMRHRIAGGGLGDERLKKMGMQPFVSQARVHVVICTSPELYRQRYREPDKFRLREKVSDDDLWRVPYWYTDAGCAMMLILLAAVDEGLAAGFMGSPPAHLRGLLGIPEEYIPVGVALIGHEAPDARQYNDIGVTTPKPKRPAKDVVHRGKW